MNTFLNIVGIIAIIYLLIKLGILGFIFELALELLSEIDMFDFFD